MKYRNIYFDLDRTIWDFDQNSRETLSEIYKAYKLGESFESVNSFISIYNKHNVALWSLYREGKIKKSLLTYKRFYDTLLEVNIDDVEMAKKIGQDYITISPTKTRLFSNAIETLEYLKKKYSLYIITNGFKEVQSLKLKNSNLDKYFKKVFISEEVGAKKPSTEIFKYALTSVNAKKSESIMIGDDIDVDILGAKNFGMDQIYFNQNTSINNEMATYEIQCLSELMEIL